MSRIKLAASSALAVVLAASGAWASTQPAEQPADEVWVEPAYAALGDSVSGELVEGDSRTAADGLLDRYVLDLQAGTRVEIIMRSDVFDPYLIAGWLGPNGWEQIALDDDGLGEGLNSRLWFTAAETGRYEIRARGYAGMGAGAYTLSFAERAPAAATQTAGSLAVGGAVNGTLADSDPSFEWAPDYRYDEYRFTARAGDLLEVVARSDAFDTIVTVQRETRWGVVEQIAYDDDGLGEGVNSRARFAAPEDGEYAIRIGSFDPAMRGDYSLALNAREPWPEPTPVVFGAPVDGGILDGDPTDDYDLPFDAYVFSATEGQRLEIVARSSAIDTVLQLGTLEGPTGWNLLAIDDDGLGEGTNSRLLYTVPEAGDYYVRVTPYDASMRGAYSLVVNDRGPLPPPPPPGSIGVGDSLSGVLGEGDGVSEDERFFDEYDIQTSAGQRLSITLRSETMDTLVEVYGATPDGTWGMVIYDDDSAGNLDSRAILRADGGTYRIRATTYGMGETGDYALSVRDLGEPARPTPLRLGRSVEGALTDRDAISEAEGRYDSYGFTLAEGERARFVARSEAFDTFLVVTRPLGDTFEILTYDDDGLGDGTTNSRAIFTAPETGEYQLWVLPMGVDGLGAYSIESSALGPTPESRPIQLGQTIEGRLEDGDGITIDGMNFDGFTFDGQAGRRIRVEMRSGDFDAYLLLGRHDEYGLSAIAEDDDGLGEGTDSRLNFTLPGDGLYEVWATSYAPGEAGAYSITFTDLGPAPQPGSLVLGSTVRGSLSEDDPVDEYGSFYDAYRFQAAEGERVRITLTSNEFDTFIYLGQMVDGVFVGDLQDDDGLSDLNSRLDFTADGRGEYVLRVRSYGPGETGEYVLSVEPVSAADSEGVGEAG